MGKEDHKQVLCLNLLLYTSLHNINPEISGNTYFFIRFSLEEPEIKHVRLTRIAVGTLPSRQMELSSFPKRFPVFLTLETVYTWSCWDTWPLEKHDVIQGHCFSLCLPFASKEERRPLPGIVSLIQLFYKPDLNCIISPL